MKKINITFLFFLIIISVLSFATKENFFSINKYKSETKFKEGDIILQTSENEQCEAVRIATNSKFSHCGIIFNENGKQYVYEAVQPVSKTPLNIWIKNGKEMKYIVRRLKNKTLSKNEIEAMKNSAESYVNKDYDIYFEWNDNTIYCSELVWKVYNNGAKIKLCETKKLKDFNLKHPVVKQIMKQRYGSKIPYNEEVVAPSQLAETKTLETVFNNYN